MPEATIHTRLRQNLASLKKNTKLENQTPKSEHHCFSFQGVPSVQMGYMEMIAVGLLGQPSLDHKYTVGEASWIAEQRSVEVNRDDSILDEIPRFNTSTISEISAGGIRTRDVIQGTAIEVKLHGRLQGSRFGLYRNCHGFMSGEYTTLNGSKSFSAS
jgi:hypothetical protein